MVYVNQVMVEDSEEVDMSSPLDVSQCSTAEEAAREIQQFLTQLAGAPSGVILHSPDEVQEKRNLDRDDVWEVIWESQRASQWAVNVTGGGSIFAPQFSQPEIVGIREATNWEAQAKSPSVLHIYPD